LTDAAFEKAAAVLARARAVAVVSGAGVSAESGVPTFRSMGGLWEQHPVEDVATPDGFRRNPRLVWEFYEARRRNMGSVEPNPGHLAIAEMQKLYEEFSVVTQNVDGLHRQAGSSRVLELHGSLWRARCAGDCGRLLDPYPYPAPEIPPHCECGALLRPDVVWFGEGLPSDVLDEGVALARSSDVTLVVGTSGVVWPAAGIPLDAQMHGAFTIEVNPERTELTSRLDVSLRGPSGEVLPRLLERVLQLRKGGAAGRERS
jgi:NAD-dependent deacetylase